MKRLCFALCMIMIAAVAYSAPGDKRPAVTSAAIGLGTSSSATMASVTATTSVTAPSFNSTAADGYHYILPYNSTAFAGTPSVGMFVTTPTGPQWYTGSEWEAIGGAGDSLPSQTGNSGKYLTTNGTAASWGTIAAGSGIAISADIPTGEGVANLNDTTHVLTVASSTGYTQFTGTHTAWDTTPDAFAFTDLTDAALSTTQTATPVQVTDINYPTAVTATGGTAAICTGATVGTCGTFSASPGNIVKDQYVSARHTSSDSNSTAVDTTVTIGGVSDVFRSTTAAGGYSDTFTGADSTLLATHDANWLLTTYSGGSNNMAYLLLSSNALSVSAYKAVATYYSSSSEDTSEAVSLATASTAGKASVCVRMASDNTGYCAYMATPSGGNWTSLALSKNNTWLVGKTISAPQTGDHTIKIVASGTDTVNIDLYLDGTLVVSHSDSSSPIASGHPGVFLVNNSGSTAYVAMDSWKDF